MAQFHFDPHGCLELMFEEVPEYERPQQPPVSGRWNACSSWAAGPQARVVWAHRDLAVLVADRR